MTLLRKSPIFFSNVLLEAMTIFIPTSSLTYFQKSCVFETGLSNFRRMVVTLGEKCPNIGKYGPEKLRIWALFMQCYCN